jgi:integrase
MDFDLEAGAAVLETLKKRMRGVVRQVPLPWPLVNELDRVFSLRDAQRDPAQSRSRLWPWSRVTGWRRVKKAMAIAGVCGACAMPKGLRHAFGVTAFQRVPPHLVQRWMGHASLRTTAIYGDVMGPEERSIASRMWRKL